MKQWMVVLCVLILSGGSLYAGDNLIKLNDVLEDKTKQDQIIDNYIKDIKKELGQNQDSETASDKLLSNSKNEIKNIQIETLTVEDKDEANRIREFTKIELVDNEMVRFFIQYYTTAGREYLTRSLERMETYYPTVEKYLKKYGLPLELSLLIIVESGYMPKALSTKGALGLWQLMPVTGKVYGLKINQLIDERMDVEKSSYAAARYIRDLIEAFNGNWELVLASYNGGGGYINSQIRKQKETNFWKLCKTSGFKSETLEYVPRFYALLHILKNPDKYDIKSPMLSSHSSFESITNPKDLSFGSIAQYSGIPESTLRELNPHFKQDIAVKYANLYIPSNMSGLVVNKINRFSKHEKIVVQAYTKNENYLAAYQPSQNSKRKDKPSSFLKHIVQNKETLNDISKRYSVSVSKIKKFNNVKRLQKGMVLQIPVYSVPKKITPVSIASAVDMKSSRKRGKTPSKIYSHKVQDGDTLMSISRRYNVNVNDIKRQNNLKNDTIKKGMMIQVPSGGISNSKRNIMSYTVKKGDTLFSLSKRFNITVEKLSEYNKINQNNLLIGRTILIPADEG